MEIQHLCSRASKLYVVLALGLLISRCMGRQKAKGLQLPEVRWNATVFSPKWSRIRSWLVLRPLTRPTVHFQITPRG